jgi:hypothetical protein
LTPAAAIDALGARCYRSFGGSIAFKQKHPREVVPTSTATPIDPLAGEDWEQLVSKFPDATTFHTSAWCRVLVETYGHKPYYFRFAGEAGTTALLPLLEVQSKITGRRGVSLPFSDVCPALLSPRFDHNLLVNELSSLAQTRGWKHFELRGAKFLRESAPGSSTYFGHSLDLSAGFERVEEAFAANVHRNLRKAQRSRVEVEITTTKKALREFYQLLARTRRRHGVPPQPLRFFEKIHEHLFGQNRGFLVLARHEGRAIAGAIFFHFGNNGLFKFGASDERQQELRANNLVMREAIRHLSGMGVKRLHFGRTDRSNEGLRRFKLAWGAEEEIIEYYRFEPATRRWATAGSDVAERAGAIFRNLPLLANRLIGTIAYPHLD